MKKYALLAVSVLLISGLGSGAPSNGPRSGLTPESPFYVVEQTVEKIEVAVAKAPIIGSKELEAKVRANNAAERLSEAEKLRERNKTEAADRLMEKYSDEMNRSSEIAKESKNAEALTERIDNVQRDQLERMRQLREKLPEQSRKGIDKAIENSEKKLGERKMHGRSDNPSEVNVTPSNKIPEIEKPDTGKKIENVTDPENARDRAEAEILNRTEDLGVEESTNETEKSLENSSETVEEPVSRTLKPGKSDAETDNPVTGAAVSETELP